MSDRLLDTGNEFRKVTWRGWPSKKKFSVSRSDDVWTHFWGQITRFTSYLGCLPSDLDQISWERSRGSPLGGGACLRTPSNGVGGKNHWLRTRRVSTSHFIHGSAGLAEHTANLFSGLLTHGLVIDDFLTSTIMPIPKGINTNVTDSENYRGNALSSVLGRIFDLIVLVPWWNLDRQNLDRQNLNRQNLDRQNLDRQNLDRQI